MAPHKRRITRRTLGGLVRPPSRLRSAARPPTPMPGHHTRNATTSATEGINSEEVEASTSRLFHFHDVETFEDSFPSLLRLIASMNQVYRRNDSAAFWNLTGSFTTAANDIASCIAQSQFVDPARTEFIFSRFIVRLLLDTFESNHRDRDEEMEMRKAFKYVKMVQQGLALLYRSGLSNAYKNKPLPPLPVSQIFQVSRSLGNSYLPAVRSNATINDPIPVQNRQSQHVKENGSSQTELNSRSILQSLNQRHTILFFGEARIPSTFSSGCVALKFDKGNRVQAVAVSSLVSIMTSEETADRDFVQAILASFRFFITPTEFFQALRERFEMNPPTDSENASIRNNVLAVIFSWLDQHWQVDSDVVVLNSIRDFIKDQPSNERFGPILGIIRVREEFTGEDTLDDRKKKIASTTPAKMPLPDRTKFEFPHEFYASSDGLLQLNTDDGREELSRHLTMKMSQLFRQLDPIKVVKFWYEKGDSCRKYDMFKDVPGVKELAAISAYGEQLTFWIMSSIVEIDGVKGRADRMFLWLDVASRCMAHCDYASAHNIYASLSCSTVSRLKQTILRIPDANKYEYTKLRTFFEDEGKFRATFNEIRPSLPPTALLIRDIIHARMLRKGKRSSRESTTGSKQKFICFDECRATQQATRVLNKSLMEYRFHENTKLCRWLDDRLKEFHVIDTKTVDEKLYELSKMRESTQNALRGIDPWKYGVDHSTGRVIHLSFGVERKKNKANAILAFLTLLKTLATSAM